MQTADYLKNFRYPLK